MKVHFKQGWGITFIIMGVVLLFLNLILLNMGAGRGLQLFFSLFLTFIGVMYLIKPYFELRSNEVVLFNLMGMEMKRYRFEKLSDMQVMNGRVYLNTEGKSVKLKIGPMMARSNEWDEFIRKIQQEDFTSELHNI